MKKSDPNLLVFDSDAVVERSQKYGDLFEPVLKLKQKMPPLKALEGTEAGATSATQESPQPKRAQKVTPRASLAKIKRTKARKTSTRKQG